MCKTVDRVCIYVRPFDRWAAVARVVSGPRRPVTHPPPHGTRLTSRARDTRFHGVRTARIDVTRAADSTFVTNGARDNTRNAAEMPSRKGLAPLLSASRCTAVALFSPRRLPVCPSKYRVFITRGEEIVPKITTSRNQQSIKRASSKYYKISVFYRREGWGGSTI